MKQRMLYAIEGARRVSGDMSHADPDEDSAGDVVALDTKSVTSSRGIQGRLDIAGD